MIALTLKQPWASLVAYGWKSIETRSWATAYRGPIAIHSSDQMSDADMTMAQRYAAILGGDVIPYCLGRVLAVAQLVDVIPTTDVTFSSRRSRGEWIRVWDSDYSASNMEREFGDYTDGRYAWLLSDIRLLKEPIRVRGALGLWCWKDDEASLVNA